MNYKKMICKHCPEAGRIIHYKYYAPICKEINVDDVEISNNGFIDINTDIMMKSPDNIDFSEQAGIEVILICDNCFDTIHTFTGEDVRLT